MVRPRLPEGEAKKRQKERIKKWEQENPEKAKARKKRYSQSHPEKVRERWRKRNQKRPKEKTINRNAERLTDGYVKYTITRGAKVDIPQPLIELKRAIIILKRLMKEEK